MAYGEIKVDTITFTDGGIDKSVTISGLVQNPTFSGNITVTGTISGNTVRGQTVSGVTVTGTTAQFTSGTFTTITGGVATITSGVFASGNAAGPSVSVGTTTNGIYSPATNQIAIATSGTGRLFVDASGRIGIGTNSPSELFHVAGVARIGADNTSDAELQIGMGATGNRNAYIDLIGDTTYTDYGLRLIRTNGGANGDSLLAHRGTGTLFIACEDAGNIGFRINNTERARIDSSGRLLVGTSSSRGNWANQTGVDPLFQLERSGDMRASMTRTDANQFGPQFWFGKTRGAAYQVVSSGDELGEISFMGADGSELVSAASITAAVDATPGTNDMPGRLVFSTTADGASSPTERMRIQQDGNILFGKTSFDFSVAGIQTEASSTSLTITRTSGDALTLRRNTDNGDIVSFYRDGTKVGSISVTTSATAYNTSSDYRLKENVTAVTNGITRLQQLKPSRFNFIADPGTTVDGFLAHEVQDVVPEAITGEKDAVDDEGNPQYQGIDQSKLVPLLTAALQEAIGEIESLKARLTAAGI
jgi:hypothetical protein